MIKAVFASCTLLVALLATQVSAQDATEKIAINPEEYPFYVEPKSPSEPSPEASAGPGVTVVTPPLLEASGVAEEFNAFANGTGSAGATVKYRDENERIHRVDVRGGNLASVNRDNIMSTNAAVAHQEVRAALVAMDSVIGDYAEFDFIIEHIVLDDPSNAGASSYSIDLKQLIDNFEAGSGHIQVSAENSVTLVALTFIDPGQEGAIAGYRLDDEETANIAKNAILAELEEDSIDDSLFAERSRVFIAVDDQWNVQPIINYVYKGYIVVVNAISGDVEIRRSVRRAVNEFSSTACRKTSGDEDGCLKPSKSQVIFTENRNTGAAICAAGCGAPPAECGQDLYKDFHWAINNIEAYSYSRTNNVCCDKIGQRNGAGVQRLDLRVNSTYNGTSPSIIQALYEHESTNDSNQTLASTIHLSPYLSNRSKQTRTEIVAHEFMHAFVAAYNFNGLFNTQGYNFPRTLEEGLGDFLAVAWSRYAGLSTDWKPFELSARDIRGPRDWYTPTSNWDTDGTLFSHYFYLIATSGEPTVNYDKAMTLAFSVARNIDHLDASPPGTIDIRDFAVEVDRATAGDSNLRKAACDAWSEMEMPYPFCQASCAAPLGDAGGVGGASHTYQLNNTAAHTVDISFEAYTIPDRLTVTANGQTIASTNGLVSGYHEWSVNYNPAVHGTQFLVNVGAPNSGTQWQLCIDCANGDCNSTSQPLKRKTVNYSFTPARSSWVCPATWEIDGKSVSTSGSITLTEGSHAFSLVSNVCYCTSINTLACQSDAPRVWVTGEGGGSFGPHSTVNIIIGNPSNPTE